MTVTVVCGRQSLHLTALRTFSDPADRSNSMINAIYDGEDQVTLKLLQSETRFFLAARSVAVSCLPPLPPVQECGGARIEQLI